MLWDVWLRENPTLLLSRVVRERNAMCHNLNHKIESSTSVTANKYTIVKYYLLMMMIVFTENGLYRGYPSEFSYSNDPLTGEPKP